MSDDYAGGSRRVTRRAHIGTIILRSLWAMVPVSFLGAILTATAVNDAVLVTAVPLVAAMLGVSSWLIKPLPKHPERLLHTDSSRGELLDHAE